MLILLLEGTIVSTCFLHMLDGKHELVLYSMRHVEGTFSRIL